MEYSNELKVGAAIVIAAFVTFAGIRFFQNVPLFGSSYTLFAEFDNAGGLTAGNSVRMKGVKIGSVERVRLDSESQVVRAQLPLDPAPHIPQGSHAQVSGISALGGVHIKITPGPQENEPLAEGATLSPPPKGTTLNQLTDQAPALASKADSVLTGANSTITGLQQQLRNPDSDFRQALLSLRNMSNDLEQVTEAEKENIRQLIRNLEGVSSDLKEFTGENGDSLDVAVRRLNTSLDRLQTSLASVRETSDNLDQITTKLNNGEGTAGRLINDPGLYVKLDSAAARANRILLDFQENPSRYLDDMTLVKVF